MTRITPPAGHKELTGNKLDSTAKAVKFQVLAVNGIPLESAVTTWFPLSQTKSIFTDPTELDKDKIVITDWIYSQKKELHE